MGSLRRFYLRSMVDRGYQRLIETGSGKGYAIEYALRQGMQRIESVDAAKEMYQYCKELFQSNPNVYLVHGSSVDFLRDINDYSNSIVFLDAHCGADFDVVPYEVSNQYGESFPLISELNILLDKDTSNTVIIIDDARMWFEDCTSNGKCPVFARRWDELPELLGCLKKLERTHSVTQIPLEEGYILALPHGMRLYPVMSGALGGVVSAGQVQCSVA